MCLDNIIERVKPDSKKSSGIGYKVFIAYSMVDCKKGPFGVFYAPPGTSRYPIGKWVAADGPGFHVFTSLKSATKWRGKVGNEEIRQVRYRKAHTIGKDGGGRCVVAEEIKVGRVIKSARN
jgi:hypothetical protein